jgi:hypothetical protein
MAAFLKARVSRKEARSAFCPPRRRLWRRLLPRSAAPCRIELIRVPYRVFECRLEREGDVRRVRVAIDGLEGSAWVYTDEEYETVADAGTPAPEPLLSEEEAREKASRFCRGLVLERGLQVKLHFAVRAVRYLATVFYPYWVGYFRRAGRYDFRAVDALSGEVRGGVMRRVFLKAFRRLDAKSGSGVRP